MQINKKTKTVALAIGLLLVAACLAFPELLIPAADLGRKLISKVDRVLPIIPLIVYGGLFLNMWSYLWKNPESSVVNAMDKQESASLTLTGLCFTSLSLLISFFKDEIKGGKVAPQSILLYFAIALGCFIASYMTLRYRTKNIFPLASEAFIDNGLWCILAGLWKFSSNTPGLENLPRVLTAFIFLYFFYLGLNAFYYYKYSHKKQQPAAPAAAPAL
jgi:hypothetical protein